MLQRFKQLLTMVGANLPASMSLHPFQMVLNYIKLGRWMRRMGFLKHGVSRVPNRPEVFDAVLRKVRHKSLLYLEFGVYHGTSMNYWSQNLKNPDAILHGFDSFEGLPEDFDFDGPITRSTHQLNGKMPVFDDNRVRLFKGWFEDVLPRYDFPDRENLVVVIDTDLYSSAKYVLNYLDKHLRPGSYLYFDDMSRPEHEPRAFEEFIAQSGHRFALVSVDFSLNRAFFECVD